MKKKLNLGHTNNKYIENNHLIIVKQKNKFNHNLDYKLTQQFDFVPRLIKETKTEVVWEYLKNIQLKKPTKQDLITIAMMLVEIHNSKIGLPKNNLRKRVQHYLKIIHQKQLKIPEIENNYRSMVKLLANMRNINPCHNDIWPDNIIKDVQGKIWLVDWEYATMGDPYYDLSYWIEAARLNKEQEQIFLQTYFKAMDNFNLDEKILEKYKIFCNWITLCWAYAQIDEPPFDLTFIKKKLNHQNM